MTLIWAGSEVPVVQVAYNEGRPAWYKVLLPTGLAWIRAEEVIQIG